MQRDYKYSTHSHSAIISSSTAASHSPSSTKLTEVYSFSSTVLSSHSFGNMSIKRNPVLQISREQQTMLSQGTAKIIFKGQVEDEGRVDQPISVYVSDKDNKGASKTCPLIFTIMFSGGTQYANHVEISYMQAGKEIPVKGQDLDMGVKRGEEFTIVLHVQPNHVQPEINHATLKIRPLRPMGYDDANFLFVDGIGLAKATIDIQKDCK